MLRTHSRPWRLDRDFPTAWSSFWLCGPCGSLFGFDPLFTFGFSGFLSVWPPLPFAFVCRPFFLGCEPVLLLSAARALAAAYFWSLLSRRDHVVASWFPPLCSSARLFPGSFGRAGFHRSLASSVYPSPWVLGGRFLTSHLLTHPPALLPSGSLFGGAVGRLSRFLCVGCPLRLQWSFLCLSWCQLLGPLRASCRLL